MANNKKKQTREERLEKKRAAERLRYQRLKNDPVTSEKLKEKERRNYLNKKEKSIIRSVKDMTPREQRAIRKVWAEKTRKRRARLAHTSAMTVPATPPAGNQELPLTPLSSRKESARKRSAKQRRQRNLLILQQQQQIIRLKKDLARYKKQIYRLNKRKEKQAITPNTKIAGVVNNIVLADRDKLKQQLLFSEVMQEQLKQNYNNIDSEKEKIMFRRVISGKLTTKYKVLNPINIKPSGPGKEGIFDMSRKTRCDKIDEEVGGNVIKFLEEDCNSRLCPGKREYISRNKVKKQKRLLLDEMQNLHKKFLSTYESCRLSYSMFCKMRPFWIVEPRVDNRDTCLCIVHENMNLTLLSLSQMNISPVSNHQALLQTVCCDRYSEECLSRTCENCNLKSLTYGLLDDSLLIKHKKWISAIEEIEDPKTAIKRKVKKYTKKILTSKPSEVIKQLEADIKTFLNHEYNILHQYSSIKKLKTNLTEKDCVIHMDFSENYNTKYSSEIQAFHFGGSRTQLSLHTVVLYTKESTECFCTISANLSHNVPAIWAHLNPILQALPETIENIHFVSDGPVTQYRNKYMFFFLACVFQKIYSNVYNYTWNYHEAGHGKGAPDGVGAVCKRTADKLVATGTDISSLAELVKAIEDNCKGIKTFIITNENILEMASLIEREGSSIKAFAGTLKVHQVQGTALNPYSLVMKGLSCFCSESCSHYNMGKITYPHEKPNRLTVTEVYSDSDHDVPGPSKIIYTDGDYVLVKFKQKKTQYRYVGICSGFEDDGEILVQFLRSCNDTSTLFKVKDNDKGFVRLDDIIIKLPQPTIVISGDRVFLKFQNPVDVYEQ